MEQEMNTKSEMKYKDMTEAQFEYECRDFRREAYGRYAAFGEKRKEKHLAEEKWQSERHWVIVRWLHNWWYRLQEHWDDETEVELLSDANPMAGFNRFKELHAKK